MRKLILFSFFLTFLSSTRTTAQEDWNWKSPYPQGNPIHQIFVGNESLFGVGDCGTVISSANTGASWNVLNRIAGVTDNITAFQKFDENTYYTGTNYNTMQKTTNGGVNWSSIGYVYENSPTGITGLAYTSSSVGYVSLAKKIYKTTNSGSSWNLLITVPDQITSLYFIDNSTGFATTMGGMEGGVAMIYKTTNAGNNWTPSFFSGWQETFKLIKFVNGNTGFLLSGGMLSMARLYKTTNQGTNWIIVSSAETFGCINIFDENNFIGTDHYEFKITTDGGTTWVRKTQPYMEPVSMCFQSMNKGYILDKNNRISVTENGGDNWLPITEANGNGSASDIVKNMKFVNDNTGYICGNNNYFKKTTNAGETWTKYETGLTGVSDLDFIDANTGFVSGTNSWQIYLSKTTNGGANFTTSFVYDAYVGTKVKFINANTGFITGYYNFLRTSNAGASWQRFSFPDSIDVYSIDFVDENTGMFCCGLYQSFVSKVYRTTNAGMNWIPVYSTPAAQYNQLGKIKMISNQKGYIAGYGIWKTSNGGASWAKLYINGIPQTTYISSLDFINEQTGYAGATGVLYRTTNGGTNWATGSVPTLGRFEGIKFFNSSTGIIAGYNGVVLKTTNGGGVFLTNITTLNNTVANEYKLHQNYPNPFNPVTNIQFDIPKNGFVTVKVYDILGKEVENLLSDFKYAGSYLISFDAGKLSSGVYFYKLETNNIIQTKRMVVLK